LGFRPLAPSEFPLLLTPEGSRHQQQEQVSAQQYVQRIAHRHSQVTEALKVAHQKAKARRDQHRTPLEFQPGDRVWLKLDKHGFKGQHHKMHPLRYGPYKILERIGDNAYRHKLPPQLGIHDVLNVNNLKPFEPPLLEEEVQVHHPMDVIQDFQPPLRENTILEQHTQHTRAQNYTSYLVGQKGELPVQARWYSTAKMLESFPHLMSEARDASGSKQGGIGLT